MCQCVNAAPVGEGVRMRYGAWAGTMGNSRKEQAGERGTRPETAKELQVRGKPRTWGAPGPQEGGVPNGGCGPAAQRLQRRPLEEVPRGTLVTLAKAVSGSGGGQTQRSRLRGEREVRNCKQPSGVSLGQGEGVAGHQGARVSGIRGCPVLCACPVFPSAG